MIDFISAKYVKQMEEFRVLQDKRKEATKQLETLEKAYLQAKWNLVTIETEVDKAEYKMALESKFYSERVSAIWEKLLT